MVLVETEDFESLKWYFNIKGIFLCDEAIVSLINLHFEAMKQFLRYWNPWKRSADAIGRSVSVSEARNIGTSATFADDPSWVLRWPSVSVSRDWCWVRTESPPQVEAQGRLFKLAFWHLTFSALKHCHMALWLAQLALTHHHPHRLHQLPSAMLPGDRVSSSFLIAVFVFFSGRLPFALIRLGLELLSSSLFG
jgi:hypothetical protein